MKRRNVNLLVILSAGVLAAGAVLWWTHFGLAGEVERRGGRVIDEARTPEGPMVSVVFTARPVGDADMTWLRGRSGFQRLFLDSTRVRGDCLEILGGAKDLRWLSLGGCPVTDEGLAHLPELPGLELLNLNYTRVTDAGIKHVSRCKNLQRLFLARTAVTDAGLDHLRGLDKLVEIDASETKVTEDGVRRLKAAIPRLTKVNYGMPED